MSSNRQKKRLRRFTQFPITKSPAKDYHVQCDISILQSLVKQNRAIYTCPADSPD